MSGHFTLIALSVSLAAAVVAASSPEVLAQTDKPAPEPASIVERSSPPAMDPMMEKHLQLGKPGPHHEILQMMVGVWDAKTKFWMAPDAPPMEGTGVMKNSLVLDGRFLREEYKTDDFMGMTFSGLGYFGYDNVQQKYVSTWMDSMTTGVMTGYGDYDPATKAFTTIMEASDPMTGAKARGRHVTRILDNDHMVYEMHRQAPDGKEIKEAEIHYTRRAKHTR